MPNEMTFKAEFEVWKKKCAGLPTGERYNIQLMESLQLADKDFFPNIHEIFKLILTSPIGSVPCKRSFSALKTAKGLEWVYHD